MPESVVRYANAARLGDAFQSRGNIDAVAENITFLNDDITDVNADTDFNTLVDGDVPITLRHSTLCLDCTAGGIHGATEFDQDPVARALERALRLSPHDPTAYLQLTGLSIAHLAAGRFEEAAAMCNKACQSNPRFSFPVVLQTAALSRLGRANEAKAMARRVLDLEPRFSVAEFVRAHTGRAEIWNPIGDALRHVGLPE